MKNALLIHPKVAGGALGGALALIVLWAMSYFVTVPPEVAAAITVVLTFLSGWLSPTSPPWLAAAPPTAKEP